MAEETQRRRLIAEGMLVVVLLTLVAGGIAGGAGIDGDGVAPTPNGTTVDTPTATLDANTAADDGERDTATGLADRKSERFGGGVEGGSVGPPATNRANATIGATAASGTITAVVYNYTSGNETRYDVSGLNTSTVDDSLNDDPLEDDRKWVYRETGATPWDQEFAATVRVGKGCTGALVSDAHVLTSLHCLYDDEDGTWYNRPTVAPAAEQIAGDPTKPFGVATAELARTYAPAVDSNDIENDTAAGVHDLALLTLDRPIGERAGTYDLASLDRSVNDTVYRDRPVDVAGYPGTPPNESAADPTLWIDEGNTTGAVCEGGILGDCYDAGLSYDVATSKGQSGAPVVHNRFGESGSEYVTDKPVVVGVHSFSTSNSNDTKLRGWGPRITETRADHISAWIDRDERGDDDGAPAHKPTRRPTLSLESVETRPPDEWRQGIRFAPDREFLAGEPLTVTVEVVNVGGESYNGSIDVTVAVGDDIFHESVTVDSFAPGDRETVDVVWQPSSDSPTEVRLLDILLGQPDGTADRLVNERIHKFVVRNDSEDWPGHGYDRRNTHYDPHTTAPRTDDAAVAWQDSGPESVYVSPAVDDGVVYVADQGNTDGTATVTARSVHDGTVQWTTDVTGIVQRAGLAVDGDTLYVPADGEVENGSQNDGLVYALDTQDGSVEWSTRTSAPAVHGLTLGDDWLYVASGGLQRLDPASGAVDRTTESFSVGGHPAIRELNGNGRVIVGGGTVRAFERDLTAEDWNLTPSDHYVDNPTLYGKRLFVAGNDTLSAHHAGFSGHDLWTFDPAAEFDADVEPVAYRGRVVVGDKSGTVHARYTANGTEAWTTDVGDGVKSIAGADGTVYVTTAGDEIHAVDALNGSHLWSRPLSGSAVAPPAITNGTVVVGTSDGTVHAIRELVGPTAAAKANRTAIAVGDTVAFDASDTVSPDGDVVAYEWDFTGDGTVDATGATATHTVEDHGQHTVTLTVEDEFGSVDTTTLTITAEGPLTVGPSGEFDAIGDAIDEADPAYVTAIEIGNGTYEETVTLDGSVDLVAAGGAEPLLVNPSEGSWSTDPDPTLTVTAGNATVRGVAVENPVDEDATSVAVDLRASNTTLDDVAIANASIGVDATGAGGETTITDSRFEGGGVRLGGPDNAVLGTTVVDAIVDLGGGTGTTIDDVTFDGAAGLRPGGTTTDTTVTNTVVNGAPLRYVEGVNGRTVDDPTGQVVVVNAADVTVADRSIDGGRTPVVLRDTGAVTVSGGTFSNVSTAIDARNVSTLSVDSTQLADVDTGIAVRDGGTVTVANVGVDGYVSGAGVEATGSEEVTVRDSTITGAGGLNEPGIETDGVGTLSVNTTTVDKAGRGINASSVAELQIVDSTVTNADTQGIHLSDIGGGTIESTTVTSGDAAGLVLYRASDLTVADSEVTGNALSGVDAEDVETTTFRNNEFAGSWGLSIDTVNQTHIVDNDIEGTSFGALRLRDTGADNRIANNNVTGVKSSTFASPRGILVKSQENVSVRNNTVTGDLYNGGIAIANSPAATVENNTVSRDTLRNHGIRVTGSPNAVVASNDIDWVSSGEELVLGTVPNATVVDQPADSVRLGDGTTEVETVIIDGVPTSFTGTNVVVEDATGVGIEAPPYSRTAIGQYYDWQVTQDGGWLNLTVSYAPGDVDDVDESTLELWGYNETDGWTAIDDPNVVDTDERTVTANVSDPAVDSVAPLGESDTLTVGDYANGDGIVDTRGLRWAVRDWRTGTINTALLLEVIEHWQNGDPV